MELTISKDELFSMMKTAVRDVLHEERMNIFLEGIPEASVEEMEDIVALHGKPGLRAVAHSETIEI